MGEPYYPPGLTPEGEALKRASSWPMVPQVDPDADQERARKVGGAYAEGLSEEGARHVAAASTDATKSS